MQTPDLVPRATLVRYLIEERRRFPHASVVRVRGHQKRDLAIRNRTTALRGLPYGED